MAVKIYSKDKYNVYLADDGYIVHNTRKDFTSGHTHLESYKTAKYLINLAIHKSMPHHLSRYLLISLIRIADDTEYSGRIAALLSNKKRKQVYVNGRKK